MATPPPPLVRASAAEALAGADAADLTPVVGDPVDDPRYAEYFTTAWVDRIRPNF